MDIIRPVTITDAMFISSNLPEDDETAYAVGTTYDVDDMVMVVATHRLYKSLKTGNTGNYPPDNLADTDPWWQLAGATNKWKAFDKVVGNQAEHATVLEYEIKPGSINSIAFQNTSAVSATVIMIDPTDGEVFNETVNFISTGNVFDWYSYYFEPILQDDAAVIWNLPPYALATIYISIENGTSDVGCGEIIVGAQRTIGRTKWRPSVGVTNYSRKTTDPTGSFEIDNRAFSKTMNCDLRMKSSEMDDVTRLLTKYYNEPLVWVAADGYSSLMMYGFAKNFRVVLQFVTYSECTLDIESLT